MCGGSVITAERVSSSPASGFTLLTRRFLNVRSLWTADLDIAALGRMRIRVPSPLRLLKSEQDVKGTQLAPAYSCDTV